MMHPGLSGRCPCAAPPITSLFISSPKHSQSSLPWLNRPIRSGNLTVTTRSFQLRTDQIGSSIPPSTSSHCSSSLPTHGRPSLALRFIYPTINKFSLQLFSPNTWEAIPGTKVQLEDWEYVTCMKHLYLSSEGMHSGQRGFIVVGTNFSYGEDITSRGHVK